MSLAILLADISSASDIITNFTSIFSNCFTVITGNPALVAILVTAVGAPILGAVISIFKGR